MGDILREGQIIEDLVDFVFRGFLGGSDGKESACNAADSGLIPGLGRSSGYGSPLQYSCLENSMDRGAWQAIVMRSRRVGHTHAHRVFVFTLNNMRVFWRQ